MFMLRMTDQDGRESRLQFNSADITIGRATENDIVIPKGNVSKRHARVVFKDGRLVVVDLNSTNGTFINGQKVTKPTVLRPDDELAIGDCVFRTDGGPADDGAPGRRP